MTARETITEDDCRRRSQEMEEMNAGDDRKRRSQETIL